MTKYFLIFIIILMLSSCSKQNTNIIEETSIEETLSIMKAPNEGLIGKNIDEKVELVEKKNRIYEDLEVPTSNIIEIGEKNYLTRINNIKNKINLYKDKTIVVEGMFATFSSWDESFKGDLVYRSGPNDFLNDIWAGFFLDDLKNQDLKVDDWIKVKGKPYIYSVKDTEGTNYDYLFLAVESIEKLENRGSEFVND